MNRSVWCRRAWPRAMPALMWVAIIYSGAAHAQAPAVQPPAAQPHATAGAQTLLTRGSPVSAAGVVPIPAAANLKAPPALPGKALWWPGFIDARGKAFLELADDAKLCALARNALHKAAAPPGRVMVLPVKVETLLPRDARLVFGLIDTQGVASERVMTRVVTIARGGEKGACAHIAEAGADAPLYVAEEDRTAFGVHPPRPLLFRAPLEAWRSYGAIANVANADARFAPAADVPAAWRTRVTAITASPAEIFGQRFSAVLTNGAAAEALVLNGAIAADGKVAMTSQGARSSATYNTVNLIVRDAVEGSPLFQAGPSGGIERNRAGSYVAQVAGTIDLDGDGIEEIILRARYYSGGNLKVLQWLDGKFVEVRQSAYEGE